MIQTLVYTIIDLCRNPEYITAVKQELQSRTLAPDQLDLNALPGLESILRESARLNSSESSKSMELL